MANAITHATALRTDFGNLTTGTSTTYAAGASQKFIVFSGTMPTNAATALSGNTAIATITALSWGAASAAVVTLSSSTADSSAVGGTASFFRVTKSDGTSCIWQGTIGTSGTDAIIGSTTIAAGANVSLTGTNTYTATP